jgi:hypothetical protein
MVADAREVVRTTLRDHRVEPLERGVLTQGGELLRTYEETVPAPL